MRTPSTRPSRPTDAPDALDSETVLRAALEGSQDGLLVTDLEGAPQYYNQRLLELLPLEEEALDHATFEEALAEIRALFRRPGRFEEALRYGREHPDSVTEHEFRLRDGTVVQRFARPFRVDGEAVGRVSTLRDVTELRENERRLQAAQHLAAVGSWEWDLEAGELHWSGEMYRIYGCAPDTFEPDYEAFLDRIHPEDREAVEASVAGSLETGEEYTDTFRIVRPDGEVRFLRAYGEVVTDHAGDPTLLRGANQDVTDLETARRAHDRAERRYRTVFELSPLALVVSRPDGPVVAANDRFEALFGYATGEVEGEGAGELALWVNRQDRAEILDRLSAGEVRDFETRLQDREGELIEAEVSVRQVEADGEDFLVWAIRDVTERKQYQRELEHRALYDQLTGLPNRTLLFDRIEQAMRRARRRQMPFSVLFVDLDAFKAINTSYGHTVGDRILAQVASRLQDVTREDDTLGRIGGDEFLAVLPDSDEVGAQKVARRLLMAVDEARFEVPDGTLGMEASIGIAVMDPEEGLEPAELIAAADVAMQRAKASGPEEGLRFRVYEAADASRLTRLQRRERLRQALEVDELVLHYQPIMDLRTGEVAGAEALVRWNHPERGLLSPVEFIPLAEQSGLIAQVDQWAIRHALAEAAGWIAEAPVEPADLDFRMAVNISPPFYQSPDFVEHVWEALEAAELPPDRLDLEITERLSVSKSGGWSRIRGSGVRLAIDDFGAGYSSLRYLRQLEADILKVDRYFVQELEDEANRPSVLVGTILALGRQMDMEVVAEGVETEAQRDHLVDLGCEYAQGYYWARPMPAEEFRAHLAGTGAGDEGPRLREAE